MYRQFAYLDIDRIQSILAQLNEGVVTQIVTGDHRELKGKAGATAGVLSAFLPVSFEGSGTYRRDYQSSKVLHDHAFQLALEAIEEGGLLLDVSAGMPVTVTSETPFVLGLGSASVLDYRMLTTLAENWKDLERILSHGAKPDGNTAQALKTIRQLVGVFMEDLLVLRFTSDGGHKFVGPLNRGHLRDDIRGFIFKHGSRPAPGWTLLAEVSAVPSNERKIEAFGRATAGLNIDAKSMSTMSDLFDVFIELISGLQEVAASVSHPSVAIAPVALYREVSG